MKHLAYLKYLCHHKLFVAVECFKVGLIKRGLLHDWHKFLPSEWFPYVEYFHGRKVRRRDPDGYYKPFDTGDPKFDFAWLLHQKRADHHWQFWLLPEDSGNVRALPMSPEARLEMLCDWVGASKAQGHRGWLDVPAWYEKHKHQMVLAPATRDWIEATLRPYART
jgi:hypothetical protein